jgi:hypothetical protein
MTPATIATAAAGLALTGLACDCSVTAIDFARDVSATVDATITEGSVQHTWHAGGMSTGRDILFNDDRRARSPTDLTLEGLIQGGATDTTLSRSLGFVLVVHGVSTGPAEIPLDDQQASLAVGFFDQADKDRTFQGLQGHLSVTALSQDCGSPGNSSYCLLAGEGTFAFSATLGADTVSVTNGTFRAHDTWGATSSCVNPVGE